MISGGNTAPVETYAASKGVMIWGADMPADDWRKISAKEVAKRAIQRIEAKGKGVLLLHDIHERTVEALPVILKELKERGYRIVHVVPADAEHPATPTVASDWQMHSRPKPAQVAALPGGRAVAPGGQAVAPSGRMGGPPGKRAPAPSGRAAELSG